MRIVLRWLLRAALAMVLIAIAVPAGFLGLSAWRETVPAGRDGLPGYYVQAAGLDIHYKFWGPEEGPVIILVHGTASWSETWDPVAEQLAGAGYQVLAPDMPPFGYTTRPVDGDYSRKALAARIIGFADAMKIDRFLLVGHSFGGGGTIEAAMLHPERIAGLALLDPAMGLAEPNPDLPLGPIMSTSIAGDALIATTFNNPWATGYGLRSFVRDSAVITPVRLGIYRQPLEVAGSTQAVRHWFITGLFGDERAARSADPDNYRTFDKPVLLIWGREDTVTPLAQGEELAALLPRSRLAVLDAVNHIPQIELPEKTADLIAGFAREVFSTPAAASVPTRAETSSEGTGTLLSDVLLRPSLSDG